MWEVEDLRKAGLRLTVTKVVFEFENFLRCNLMNMRLTVTKVVFEFMQFFLL